MGINLIEENKNHSSIRFIICCKIDSSFMLYHFMFLQVLSSHSRKFTDLLSHSSPYFQSYYCQQLYLKV